MKLAENFDARYRVVMANIEDAVVFLSVQTGRIEGANDKAANILGMKADTLTGATFSKLFSDRTGAELLESLMNATLSNDAEPISVRATRTQKTLSLVPVVFRAGGQRVLMCRVLENAKPFITNYTSSDHDGALIQQTTDGIIFMDLQGSVLSVNDAFLNLVGAANTTDVVGSKLSDFMARGQIDLDVLLENTNQTGHMRAYATRLINDLGARVPVEASTTRLNDPQNPVIALIMRDVSRLDVIRTTESQPTMHDPAHNVMDLVGSASLKDIVAETTDVVEKMCIETAVSLTRNNRVAAAEMLGLSRQSLYVKLRKFGLLAKE